MIRMTIANNQDIMDFPARDYRTAARELKLLTKSGAFVGQVEFHETKDNQDHITSIVVFKNGQRVSPCNLKE